METRAITTAKAVLVIESEVFNYLYTLVCPNNYFLYWLYLEAEQSGNFRKAASLIQTNSKKTSDDIQMMLYIRQTRFRNITWLLSLSPSLIAS